MRAPILLWTMQRTGGTTLANLLHYLRGEGECFHEPFNLDRVHGGITARWNAERNAEKLLVSLGEALGSRPVVKHCFENASIEPEMNDALLRVSTRLGYRHVVLHRRDEMGRILSRELAIATDAWGKMEAGAIYAELRSGVRKLPEIDVEGCIHHIRYCHARRREVERMFRQASAEAFVLDFETLYTSYERGRREIADLLEFAGIGGTAQGKELLIEDFLKNKGQDSAPMLTLFPNYETARLKLQEEISAIYV